jgi:hypothetical protein
MDVTVCGGIYLGDVTLTGSIIQAHRRWFPRPRATMHWAEVKTIVRLDRVVVATTRTLLVVFAGVRRYQLGTTLYTFSVSTSNGTVSGPLHVQAAGYSNVDGTQQGGGKVFAVSNDLSSLPVSSVSEPGTFTLLTAGLFAIALLGRKARQE